MNILPVNPAAGISIFFVFFRFDLGDSGDLASAVVAVSFAGELSAGFSSVFSAALVSTGFSPSFGSCFFSSSPPPFSSASSPVLLLSFLPSFRGVRGDLDLPLVEEFLASALFPLSAPLPFFSPPLLGPGLFDFVLLLLAGFFASARFDEAAPPFDEEEAGDLLLADRADALGPIVTVNKEALRWGNLDHV